MAFALVGSAGVATQGAVNTAVTPAWGVGSSRTAGNLLLFFISTTGVTSNPGTPSGWTAANTLAGTSCAARLFYKIAAGGDTAPTFGAVASGVHSAHLEEWSGNKVTEPLLDQTGSNFGTTSPITATFSTTDLAAGELVAMVGSDFRSAARTPSNTWTSNNGTPVLQASNNGVSSAHHYSHATLITTSKSSADTAVMTVSVTTSITGLVVAAASFRLSALTSVTGTGAGAGTAATSTGSAAEEMTGTGAGTGTAASANGSGTVTAAGATGTGAGTQTVQTAAGTALETVTGSGAGLEAVATATGTALETVTGTGAGSQVVQTAAGDGTSLVAVTGTGAGTGTAASASGSGDVAALGEVTGTGAGVQVPQSAYGEGSGGEVEVPPSIDGSTIFAAKLRVITGGGAGLQARQSAKGRGRVNDDDLVVMAA